MIPAMVIGLVTLWSTLEDFFRAWFHMFLRVFYRINILGMRILKKEAVCLSVTTYPTPILFLSERFFLEKSAIWLTQVWRVPIQDLFSD